MNFLTGLGHFGGGAAKAYFDNKLGDKWGPNGEYAVKAAVKKAFGEKAKPSYTQHSPEEIAAIEGVKDENGVPIYSVSKGDSGYEVRPNLTGVPRSTDVPAGLSRQLDTATVPDPSNAWAGASDELRGYVGVIPTSGYTFMGNRFDAMPSADEQEIIRSRELARIYAGYDPEKANTYSMQARTLGRQIKDDARRAVEREQNDKRFGWAETENSNKQNDRVRLEGQRDAANKLAQFVASNPGMRASEIIQKGGELGLDAPAATELALNHLKLPKADVEAMQVYLQSQLQGKDFHQTKALYNGSKDFDPDTDIREVPVKGGFVIEWFNKANPSQVVNRSQAFRDLNEANGYLHTLALNPGTVANWVAELGYKNAQIEHLHAQSADLRNRGLGVGYYAKTAGGTGVGTGSTALQPFKVDDFIAQAKVMGIPTTMDAATGDPIFTEKHKTLMAGTQAVMARTGLPMWAAMQQAMQYVPTGAPTGAPTGVAVAGKKSGQQAPSTVLGKNTNDAYMEKFEKWKRLNERYEHFKRQGKLDQAEAFRVERDKYK